MAESAAFLKVVRGRAEEVGTEQFTHEERQLRDLVDHPGWKVVQELVGRQEQRLLSLIVPQGAGSEVLTQAAYARITGQIGGLRQFAEIAETVFKVAESRRNTSAGAGGEE